MDANRISLSTLGEIPAIDKKYLQVGEATIEVTPTLRYTQILDMIQWSVELLVSDKPFVSAALVKMVEDFAILNAYTNLNLGITKPFDTIDEIYAEYDRVAYFKIMENLLPKIDGEQVRFYKETLEKTLKSIVDYRNSAKGIIDTLSREAEEDSEKMEKVFSFMKDAEQQESVKNILEAAKAIQG